MTKLSVNINKIAYLRNSRHLDYPDPVVAARQAIEAGAQGITVHPRPDQRHIRPRDVLQISALLQDYPSVEFNIEGNPFEGDFMELVKKTKPQQATLVPDSPDSFTSDSGWKLEGQESKLKNIIEEIKEYSSRVSLFMDAETEEMDAVLYTGAERIELYTEPYANSFGKKNQDEVLSTFIETAKKAIGLGIFINAGHDLSLLNLELFLKKVPGVQEVSIGHALIADSLFYGLSDTVKKYLRITKMFDENNKF